MAICINDLQDRIGVLEDEIKRCEKKPHVFINKTRRPKPGDYYESEIEGMNESTRTPGLTWKQQYERDLEYWEKKFGK